MSKKRRDHLSRDLGKDLLKDIAKWGITFVPPSTLLITLFFDQYTDSIDFLKSFLKSMYIGEVVLIVSVTMSYLLAVSEATLFQILGKEPPERSDIYHTMRSVIFLVPGLFLAFKSLEHLAPLVGWEFDPPVSGQYKYGIFVGLASIGVWMIYTLMSAKRITEQKIQLLEKDQLSSKISALTAQMNPHLLFNALNTVAATIPDNPAAAEKMVVELAGLYRKTLEATRTDFHSLARELDLVTAYLTIEKARFGERINFQTQIDHTDVYATIIPSLMLQPIVENAVKHGLASLENGGMITIKVETKEDVLHLEIADSGIGFNNSKTKGSGTGLDNSRSRIELLYGGRAQMNIASNHPQGTRVLIEIPVNFLAAT